VPGRVRDGGGHWMGWGGGWGGGGGCGDDARWVAGSEGAGIFCQLVIN